MRHIISIIIYVVFSTVLYAQAQDSMIREGNPGEARTVSGKNQALVLHISGGEKGEKYSALQYAQMLQIMFNDSTRTKHPIKPYVLYEESGQDRATVMGVYLLGQKFDKNGGQYESGDGVFYPAEVVRFIPVITKTYADKKRQSTSGLQ